MIQANKLKFLALAGIFALISTAFGLQQIFAATGSMYITPASTSVLNGASVTVSVRINPATNIDGVEASLGYDASKLEFLSIDPSGSAFEIALGPQTGSGGTVSITRGTLGTAVSSDALVARVSFKALVGSGSSGISLSGNATASGTYINPSTSGTTITLTSPAAPTPTPTPPSTPTTSPAPAPAPTPTTSDPAPDPVPTTETPTTTTTEPKVEIAQNNVQFTKVGVVVKTTVATRVYIIYGTNGKFEFQTTKTELGKEHTVALDESKLLPGTSYNYKVISESEAGAKAETESQTIKTKGYSLRVTVIGKDAQPFKKKKVTIFSEPQTGQTDGDGSVTFTNLTAGNHTVQYEQAGKQYKKTVLVDDIVKTNDSGEQVAALQNTAVLYEDLVVPKGLNTLGLTAVLTSILLALAVFVLYKRGLLKPIQRQAAAVAPNETYTDDEPVQPNRDIFTHEYPKVPAPGVTIQPRDTDNDKK